MMALVPSLPEEPEQGREVYIVDDSLSVRKAIEHMLGPRGHRVRGGASGEQALADLADQAPDLVICDIVLPDIDGLEICRFVRSRPHLSSLPVILISGIVDDEVLRRGNDAGADAVLRKPFSGDDLVSRVEELLATRQEAAPPALPAAALGALERFKALRELRFVLLLDETGVIARIGSAAPTAGDEDEREVLDLLEAATDLSNRLAHGPLAGLILESVSGLLLLSSAGSQRALVVCLDGAALLGQARYYARRVAADLTAILDG